MADEMIRTLSEPTIDVDRKASREYIFGKKKESPKARCCKCGCEEDKSMMAWVGENVYKCCACLCGGTMDNWESLIASRMRPCASMPRHADPTKERKRRARNRYYASEKGKENRKGADARFRESHREERNEYNRKYYQEHKEYFAEYQKKYRARKAA